jgi:predicted kinase
MKTLSCDLCDYKAEGETFEQWMAALKPHYAEAHAEIMNNKKRTPEQMRAEMEKWMAENKARFDRI